MMLLFISSFFSQLYCFQIRKSIDPVSFTILDLKVEKVKNFQRNYLESGKPKSENFQGLRLQKSK